MVDLARQLCNELMGMDRNKLSTEGRSLELKFDDKRVCPYYLAGFCPHELFVNTKSDLGRCEFRYHDEALKADYMVNGERYRERIERRFLDYLKKLVNDLERKIRRAKGRLDTKPSEQVLSMMKPNKDENEEKIVLMELQVKDLLQTMETCGEEGRVQEAQRLSEQVDRLNADMLKLKEDVSPLFRQEHEMEVCDTCGAFLVMHDAVRRSDSHLEGKQHTGYVKIREELERLETKYRASMRPATMHRSLEPGELPGRDASRHRDHGSGSGSGAVHGEADERRRDRYHRSSRDRERSPASRYRDERRRRSRSRTRSRSRSRSRSPGSSRHRHHHRR